MMRRDNDGYILVTALLMLLVLTVIGLAAISTSTLENLLSGNFRLRESNLAISDGCSELSLIAIDRAVRNGSFRGFSNIVTDSNLFEELRAGSFDPDLMSAAEADITCNDGQGGITTSVVDIDVMYPKWIGGSAIEFASGYEGLGKGGGSSYATYFRVNSAGTGSLNSESTVGAIFRYVP
ncbi:MAG: pilus assembly PilX N-terminal domain-containing protein [Nitrospirae bacterium]|nr:pilus assembly PilX N-terminal domain-containing protein [Nitrospirota bacterium]